MSNTKVPGRNCNIQRREEFDESCKQLSSRGLLLYFKNAQKVSMTSSKSGHPPNSCWDADGSQSNHWWHGLCNRVWWRGFWCPGVDHNVPGFFPADYVSQETAQKMMVIDPTNMVEHMTSLFLQQSSLSEVCQQLCPQGLRPPRLYKLPKIHKEVLPGPTVSNFWAPTYQPSKNLADTVWPSWETHQNSWKAPLSLSTTHKTPVSLLDWRTWSASVWFRCSQGCHIGWPSSSWADTLNTTSWHCSVMSWPTPTSASVVSSTIRSMECQWDCCFRPLSIPHGGLHKKKHEWNCPQAPLLVSLYRWHLCNLAHKLRKMEKFLEQLRNANQNIQLTTKKERDGNLPCLYIDIYRRHNCSLGQRIHQKFTHTNLCLKSRLHSQSPTSISSFPPRYTCPSPMQPPQLPG